MSKVVYQSISVGICETSLQGVAIASYSTGQSRMWTWDAESLEVTGFQDIKAAAHLLDVSSDGQLCVYEAQTTRRRQFYIAISHPPYFRALWIRNIFHHGVRAVVLGDDGIIRYTYRRGIEMAGITFVPETTRKNCPFQFKQIGEPTRSRHWKTCAQVRCSRAIEGSSGLQDHEKQAIRRKWTGKDRCGRTIAVDGNFVVADGTPFLDCSPQEFVEVAPPKWATEW